MGELISLDDHRAAGASGRSPIARLERSVRRLEARVGRTAGRMSATVERELLLIVGAVSAGRTEEAASRAERLAGLLEHPAASWS